MSKISFLITHYNRHKELGQCIDSIHNLRLSNYEIIVSDDCSKSEHLNVVNSYKIDKLVLGEKNSGLGSNINKGIHNCSGDYIVYVQEDFIIDEKFKDYLSSFIKILELRQLDMIRLSAYFSFNKLHPFNQDIDIIPIFSWKNFYQNYYRYSDHPFIVKKAFFSKFGYYLENFSGGYGETEYGIRMAKKKCKIGISKIAFSGTIKGSQSIMAKESDKHKMNKISNKSIVRFLRAVRIYTSWIFYNIENRKLITYKNKRK